MHQIQINVAIFGPVHMDELYKDMFYDTIDHLLKKFKDCEIHLSYDKTLFTPMDRLIDGYREARGYIQIESHGLLERLDKADIAIIFSNGFAREVKEFIGKAKDLNIAHRIKLFKDINFI